MGGQSAHSDELTRTVGGLIDTHVHLWDINESGSEWLRGAPTLPPYVGVDDLVAAFQGHQVAGVVLVEAAASIEATMKLLAAAECLPWPATVIGWLDLTRTDVPSRLDEYAATGGRFRGVRLNLAGRRGERDISAGLQSLADRGLIAELLLGRAELVLAAEIAERRPEITFVIDHLCGLADTTMPYEEWERGIGLLGELPNVVVKVSGWRAIDGESVWQATRRVAKIFGQERLMFGSDWPVSARYGLPTETAAATRMLFAEAIDAGLGPVFAGTAANVYDLQTPANPTERT